LQLTFGEAILVEVIERAKLLSPADGRDVWAMQMVNSNKNERDFFGIGYAVFTKKQNYRIFHSSVASADLCISR
jgi:hypothetical protein